MNSEIRDRFAGKAMQSLIRTSQNNQRGFDPEVIAKSAYAVADAMMKRRNEGEKESAKRKEQGALGARSNR